MIDIEKRNGPDVLLKGIGIKKLMTRGLFRKSKYVCVLVDEEFDPFPVEYQGGGLIGLGTEGCSYLVLSADQLRDLADWVDEMHGSES